MGVSGWKGGGASSEWSSIYLQHSERYHHISVCWPVHRTNQRLVYSVVSCLTPVQIKKQKLKVSIHVNQNLEWEKRALEIQGRHLKQMWWSSFSIYSIVCRLQNNTFKSHFKSSFLLLSDKIIFDFNLLPRFYLSNPRSSLELTYSRITTETDWNILGNYSKINIFQTNNYMGELGQLMTLDHTIRNNFPMESFR